MKDALEVFFEIILALTGAVAFATLIVGGALLAIGCAVFGSCWGFLGWRKRRAGRRSGSDTNSS
jgi:hypothetical protein